MKSLIIKALLQQQRAILECSTSTVEIDYRITEIIGMDDDRFQQRNYNRLTVKRAEHNDFVSVFWENGKHIDDFKANFSAFSIGEEISEMSNAYAIVTQGIEYCGSDIIVI